jgi:hypothetical protein
MKKVFSFDSFGEMGEFIDFCQENNVRTEYHPHIKRVAIINSDIPVEQLADFRSAQMLQDAMEAI